MKALVFGSLNIDHVYQMPHTVQPGETLSSSQYRRGEGGKGLNQAIALARAGQTTCFAGSIGADGIFLKEFLNGLGVDTTLVRTANQPTGHAIIQVDEQGQNAILLYGGANQCVNGEQIAKTLERFSPGDYLVMQNEISHGRELMLMAKDRGMRVVLNPSPISPDLLDWPLEQADWLILNEIEGAAISGCQRPDAMLDALVRRCPDSRIVLTLGEKGALYANGTERIAQPAFPAETVDTTAAGDTFTGYFVSGMMAGDTAADALKRAACAAALAVSREGAGQSIPAASEVENRM